MTRNRLPNLAALLARTANIATIDHPLAPKKKRSNGDHPLGAMSAELKQVWLLREEKRLILDEIVSRAEDLIAVHNRDHEEHGDEVPAEIEAAFQTNLRLLQGELNEANTEFTATDRLFRAGTSLEFRDRPDGPHVLGVRKDYEIVTRNDNARGDEDDPTDRLQNLATKTIHTVLVRLSSPLAEDPKPPGEQAPAAPAAETAAAVPAS